MTNWMEGALALFVILGLGIGLFLYSGQSLGAGDDGDSQAITVDLEAATRGEGLAASQGCLECHTIDGTLIATGPTWKGLAGSTRPLTNGEEVVADDDYLLTSIVDPRTQIVEGYEAVMPTFYVDDLDDAQIDDLVEYIKSLST
ncbi:MAG: c-type cytochrome [Acidimicrobiia bacterium]